MEDMEERIIAESREPQGPAASSAAPTSTPCDGVGDALAPALLLSSGEDESSDEDEGKGELEFEFPFVSRESPSGTAAPADELFSDGRIRTFYPVFGRGIGIGGGCFHGSSSSHGGCTARPAAEPRVRGQLGRLFLEETRERNFSTSSTASTSSSLSSADDDGLEGAAPESYCVWRPGSSALSASASSSPRPPPRPPRKSGSTGSMARWRRISDLVVGRSHSDGKEKFLFFAAPVPDAPSSKRNKPATAPEGARARKPPPVVASRVTDADAAAHQRIAYLAKGGGAPPPPGGTPRRTFLPYREELVGFFANVNGISRSHQHPF